MRRSMRIDGYPNQMGSPDAYLLVLHGFIRACVLALENLCHPLLQFLLPLRNLDGVNLVLGGDLVDRPEPLQGFKRDTGFEFGSVGSALVAIADHDASPSGEHAYSNLLPGSDLPDHLCLHPSLKRQVGRRVGEPVVIPIIYVSDWYISIYDSIAIPIREDNGHA